VTLHIDEIKGYVPPQSPALGARISRAFVGSTDALGKTAETLLIVGVILAPWLALPAVVLAVPLYFVRRRRRTFGRA
jgi:hypothetical protein